MNILNKILLFIDLSQAYDDNRRNASDYEEFLEIAVPLSITFFILGLLTVIILVSFAISQSRKIYFLEERVSTLEKNKPTAPEQAAASEASVQKPANELDSLSDEERKKALEYIDFLKSQKK